jgi:hypothetical protein
MPAFKNGGFLPLRQSLAQVRGDRFRTTTFLPFGSGRAMARLLFVRIRTKS